MHLFRILDSYVFGGIIRASDYLHENTVIHSRISMHTILVGDVAAQQVLLSCDEDAHLRPDSVAQRPWLTAKWQYDVPCLFNMIKRCVEKCGLVWPASPLMDLDLTLINTMSNPALPLCALIDYSTNRFYKGPFEMVKLKVMITISHLWQGTLDYPRIADVIQILRVIAQPCLSAFVETTSVPSR